LPLQIRNLSFGAVAPAPAGGASASELNKELSNPVSSLWSISNQFNSFELNNGHWNNNWNFQSVLPIGLTKGGNLITRPVMPFNRAALLLQRFRATVAIALKSHIQITAGTMKLGSLASN
jgi:hypothetical protein